MAEIVCSAVVGEAVSKISSFISGGKAIHESVEDRTERLEMAVLKIRSVVAVSEGLHISHLPLLQWKAKLIGVAEEGDNILRAHKKQKLERKGTCYATTCTSISQYVIQAAKRFASFGREEDDLSNTTLQRFERLADGAESFFRLLESGGHPRGSMFVTSLTRSLIAGKSMEFSLRRGSDHTLILLCPWLDGRLDNGLQACLIVSREDDVMWHNNLKMIILFRLSEASNILAIAMNCLELLPPQFGAACVAIKGVLTEIIEQNSEHSNLSAQSMWCCRRIQKLHRSDCQPSNANEHTDARFLLPEAMLRLTACCYVPPSINRSSSPMNGGIPLELKCHVSPYLVPEKHCRQYEQVGPHVVGESLPKVTDGFYEETQVWERRRQIWCSQSSMYLSMAPVISQPLTTSQLYLMENCGPASKSGRRTTRAKSRNMNRSRKVARILSAPQEPESS